MHVREMRFSFQFRPDVRHQRENSTLMRESVEESQQQIADVPERQFSWFALWKFGSRFVVLIVEPDNIQTRDLAQIRRVKEYQREKYWDYKTGLLMRK